ncbi:HAD family acid phosphatase [Sphingobium aquiterrae]|uniref:HAD family acid phosphatase n=1 Tax=Sphingobium aquiterrae TaxID=2038656 RepID=UPI003018629A
MRGATALAISVMLAGCAAQPGPVPAAPPPTGSALAGNDIVIRELPPSPPPQMQYLYGSGEAGALSIQAFRALLDYAQGVTARRPTDSVVLAQGATLDAPAFAPCGDKPFAALFDVDETLVLNLGAEYADARHQTGFNTARWDRWEKTGAEKVAPVPGAVFAVNALRKMGVTVIFNSNRAKDNAAFTAQAIAHAGLGKAVPGETLFLMGDDAMGSKKDGRRWTIAARYCVIAMGGDQLGDFSDLFNQVAPVPARRMAAIRGAAAQMWGHGWFVLPNPVYGSGLKGGFDDVFPIDKRWEDPGVPKE